MVVYVRSVSQEDVQETTNEIIGEQTQGTVSPVSDSSGERFDTIEQNQTNSIRDMVRDDFEVVSDSANPSDVIIFGEATTCINEIDCELPFSITYTDTNDFFTVVLYQLPLRTTREKAEAFLIERYGLSRESLCSLDYMVSVPYWVSEEFAGVDLRFSGCSNAVQL